MMYLLSPLSPPFLSFSLLLSPSLSLSLLTSPSLSFSLLLSPSLSLYPYLSFSLSSLPLPRPSPPRPLSHCLPRPRSDDKAAATHALCSYVTSNMCLPHTPRACTQGRETRGRHRGCVHFACLHQAQDSLMPRVPRAGHIQGSLRHRLSEEWRVKHQRESREASALACALCGAPRQVLPAGDCFVAYRGI